MENRSGLIIRTKVTTATGSGERDAAKGHGAALAKDARRITLGRDKGYDTESFVKEQLRLKITPHVAQNTTNRRSSIDGRTTTIHPNYKEI